MRSPRISTANRMCCIHFLPCASSQAAGIASRAIASRASADIRSCSQAAQFAMSIASRFACCWSISRPKSCGDELCQFPEWQSRHRLLRQYPQGVPHPFKLVFDSKFTWLGLLVFLNYARVQRFLARNVAFRHIQVDRDCPG